MTISRMAAATTRNPDTLPSLDNETIDRLLDAVATIPSSETIIELAYLGGAAAEVGADDTAFGDRSAPFRPDAAGELDRSRPMMPPTSPGFAGSSNGFARR